jgi:predicted DNA-binding transcriptional regulator YafY
MIGDMTMETIYRHWLILKMIPRRGKISTTEILSRLKSQYSVETTLRTIQRDLTNMLSTVFPLECDEFRPAGWRWKDDAILEISNLDPVSALTFKLAEQYLTKMLPHGALTAMRPYFTSANNCLKHSDHAFANWPNKLRVMSRNLTTLPPPVSTDIADAVYTAVLEEKRLAAVYQTISGVVKEYDVNPLGMTFVDGLTYLIATLNEYTTPVLLLLHRFHSVQLSNTAAVVPGDFNIDECIKELLTFQVGDTIKLKLRFSTKEDVNRLKESPLNVTQKIKELPGNKYELTASVEDSLQLRWWLNGFGARLEVLAPKYLRQEFVELAQGMSDLYLTK